MATGKNDIELIFRILVFAGFVLPISAWLVHLLRRGSNGDSIISSREGLLVGISFRTLQFLSGLAIALYLAWPQAIGFAAIRIPSAIRLGGLAFLALGSFLLVWVLRCLDKNFSSTLALREKHELITIGPYAHVMHPMYDAFVLLWAGYLFLSANLAIGATGIAAQVLIMIFRTPREEKMLEERFGAVFIAYRSKTGRFMPKRRSARQ